MIKNIHKTLIWIVYVLMICMYITGFVVSKQEEQKVPDSRPLFNSQPTKVSPSLKRGRDDGKLKGYYLPFL